MEEKENNHAAVNSETIEPITFKIWEFYKNEVTEFLLTYVKSFLEEINKIRPVNIVPALEEDMNSFYKIKVQQHKDGTIDSDNLYLYFHGFRPFFRERELNQEEPKHIILVGEYLASWDSKPIDTQLNSYIHFKKLIDSVVFSKFDLFLPYNPVYVADLEIRANLFGVISKNIIPFFDINHLCKDSSCVNNVLTPDCNIYVKLTNNMPIFCPECSEELRNYNPPKREIRPISHIPRIDYPVTDYKNQVV